MVGQSVDIFNTVANAITAALLAYTAREIKAARKERRFLQHQQGRKEE
jgi:hypothetical protein